LYRAVKEVVSYQFGVDVQPDVFDKHNAGEGIQVRDIRKCLHEALAPIGIKPVVYGVADDNEHYTGERAELSPPCVVCSREEQHATAALPGCGKIDATFAIVFEKD